MVLDEYGNSGWGESDAVDAFFAGQDISLQRFDWAPGPAVYFVKRTIG